MRYRELRRKEVINVCDGRRLGCVCDVIINTATCKIEAIVVPGACEGLFKAFLPQKDIIIPWCKIRRFGDDVILVDVSNMSVE